MLLSCLVVMRTQVDISRHRPTFTTISLQNSCRERERERERGKKREEKRRDETVREREWEEQEEKGEGSSSLLTFASHAACFSPSPLPHQQESTAGMAHTTTPHTQLLQTLLLVQAERW